MRVIDNIDNVNWIIKVINSCETLGQLAIANRLKTNWIEQKYDELEMYVGGGYINYRLLVKKLTLAYRIKAIEIV
tara:strand:- start:38593 stop:38817 length:225 start_codon:yes stop_codon:yes gene_type:complete